jgi:benzoate/toluate 1,2-dioxygenase reductase subunit
MSNIALNFEDGVTRFIESQPDETVAAAAYRSGFNIPLDCADGACGTCKCKCVSGSFDPGSYIEDALSDDEALQGFALACQMRPKTNLVIDILASSAACKVEITGMDTEIITIEQLSSDIYRLVLKPVDNQPVAFLPGQYANIAVPGSGFSRSYSFSSSPGSPNMEFMIRIVPGGLMSSYLKSGVSVSDKLHLTAPLGSFYLREIKRPVLFFAGGTGIAPFLSMLELMSRQKQLYPVKLFYGVSRAENIIGLSALEAFSQKMGLSYYTCVSHGMSVTHADGHITQWIDKEILGDLQYDVYTCGPNGMVEAVKSKLEAENISFVNFYSEKFLPSGVQQAV